MHKKSRARSAFVARSTGNDDTTATEHQQRTPNMTPNTDKTGPDETLERDRQRDAAADYVLRGALFLLLVVCVGRFVGMGVMVMGYAWGYGKLDLGVCVCAAKCTRRTEVAIDIWERAMGGARFALFSY